MRKAFFLEYILFRYEFEKIKETFRRISLGFPINGYEEFQKRFCSEIVFRIEQTIIDNVLTFLTSNYCARIVQKNI